MEEIFLKNVRILMYCVTGLLLAIVGACAYTKSGPFNNCLIQEARWVDVCEGTNPR